MLHKARKLVEARIERQRSKVTLALGQNDSVHLGSAGVSPAVFGVPPKTLTRGTRPQFHDVSDGSNPPAGRRRERP